MEWGGGSSKMNVGMRWGGGNLHPLALAKLVLGAEGEGTCN